jgi:hypothetical protein
MTPRCRAELRHAHGVTQCERDAFHSSSVSDADGLAPALEEHVGPCESCEEDDGYGTATLHWTGYRESWR